jgi:hypothetical protein
MLPGATAGAQAFIAVVGGWETFVMQATWTDG